MKLNSHVVWSFISFFRKELVRTPIELRFCGARNIAHQILCSNTLNWHVLQIADAHFSTRFLKKNYHEYTFLHRGDAYMYQKPQQTRHIKSIVYQHFQFFQHLKIAFICTCNFHRYKLVHIYRRKEF